MTVDTSPEVSHLRERLRNRRTAFEGRLLKVFDDEVELPDGGPARREVVHHRGAIAVVAVTDDGGVVLVRQWRHAVEGALWEVPAGTRDEHEEPAETARRELQEETGYSAARWTPLGAGFVSPGYSQERIWFFLAEGLRHGEAASEPDENLDVHVFHEAEIADLVVRGLTDLKTMAGLARAGKLPAAADGRR